MTRKNKTTQDAADHDWPCVRLGDELFMKIIHETKSIEICGMYDAGDVLTINIRDVTKD